MSDSIDLRLVNQTNDDHETQVVIFQKNRADGANDLPVAWQVLTTSPGTTVPLRFDVHLTANAGDSFGNYAPPVTAPPGALIGFTNPPHLEPAGRAASASQIQIRNDGIGAMNAMIARDGRTLASKTGVAPNQIATFDIDAVIWIAVAKQMIQGAVLDSAILETIQTELSLMGITAADIIMTGGGPGGTTTRPYHFALANVRHA